MFFSLIARSKFLSYAFLSIAIAMILGALVFSFFILEDSYTMDLSSRFLGASKKHWLGTDQLGRDFFSLLLIGTRNSIAFASLALITGSLIGTLCAFLTISIKPAKYLLVEINKILLATPIILTAILIYTFYSASWTSLVAISLFNIPIFYYLTQNVSSRILAKEYSIFSLSIGNSKWNIYRLHIMPQLYNTWMIQFSIQWGIALLMEAGLSYLGLGIQQPTPSLGRMLFENRAYYELKIELVFYPGLALCTLVLLCNYCANKLNFANQNNYE